MDTSKCYDKPCTKHKTKEMPILVLSGNTDSKWLYHTIKKAEWVMSRVSIPVIVSDIKQVHNNVL